MNKKMIVKHEELEEDWTNNEDWLKSYTLTRMGSVREEDVEILEQEETGNNNTNGVDSINNFNNISNVHTEEQEEEAEEMEKTRTKVEKEETKSAGCEGER